MIMSSEKSPRKAKEIPPSTYCKTQHQLSLTVTEWLPLISSHSHVLLIHFIQIQATLSFASCSFLSPPRRICLRQGPSQQGLSPSSQTGSKAAEGGTKLPLLYSNLYFQQLSLIFTFKTKNFVINKFKTSITT